MTASSDGKPGEIDLVGAFVPGPRLQLAPEVPGILDGFSCAVKDVFDIAGEICGYGNPTWARTHPPAEMHSWAVDRILNSGVHIVGKTITDELAFSISGMNHHYGAPINSAAPDRLTGGSSCGSAAAVAAGLCDFALGTDTGGSVRLPASFCGLFGFRPTHDAVSRKGVRSLASSFDTVGWFARDPEMLVTVGNVLLPEDERPLAATSFHWDVEGWSLLDEPCAPEIQARVRDFLPAGSRLVEGRLSEDGLDVWFETFRTLQFAEIWAELGGWIEEVKPALGPGIAERMEMARNISPEQVAEAKKMRDAIRAGIDRLWAENGIIVIPTVPGAAPLRNCPVGVLEDYRRLAMRLLSISGLSGCPQITLPLFRLSGAPFGLSLIAPRGTDRQLLALGAEIHARAAPTRGWSLTEEA